MVFLMVGAAVFSAVVFGTRWQAARVNEAWASAGRSLGLHVTPGKVFRNPVMVGDYDGLPVRVDTYSSGSGKNSTTYTRYEVTHRPVGPPVTLTRQHALSFIGRLFGKQDVDIGDPLFDDKVRVDSDHADEVAAFLTPTRRAAVLELFSTWPMARLTHSSITLSTQRVETNPARIISTVIRLVDTAAVMAEPNEIDEILTHRFEGDLARAAEELHEVNATTTNAFTALLEAEALIELGRHDEAADVFGGVGQRLGDQGAVADWQRVAALPSPSAEVAVDPTPEASQALDQQSVIDDLFEAGRMSWQIVEYFEATYHGAVVTWRGAVTAHHTYRHDADFGEGPGTKATILLGRAGDSDFISSEVHAMVELGADADVENDLTVTFSGRLTHVDRFSRKLYVRDATIEAVEAASSP